MNPSGTMRTSAGQGTGTVLAVGGRCGFTLIEMLVVIVIFFILMGFGVMSMERMKIANSLNASAAGLASTIREARGLAMRHKKPYTLAFNTFKPTFQGEGSFADFGLPTDGTHTRFNFFFVSGHENQGDHDKFVEYQNSFQSDNENGSDHWYAILKPVYYGDRFTHGTFDRETSLPRMWRPPSWWHVYPNNDTEFKESSYDPMRLQVGPRRFLQTGVRFWRANADDSYVEGGGDVTDLFNRKYGPEYPPIYNDPNRTSDLEFSTRRNHRYFPDGGDNILSRTMLMSATTVRTLNHSATGGRSDVQTIVNDNLVAWPAGDFSFPKVEGMLSRAQAGGSNLQINRRVGAHIVQSPYSRLSRFDAPRRSLSTLNTNYVGMVWHEDRTNYRVIRMNFGTGEVTVHNEMPFPFN